MIDLHLHTFYSDGSLSPYGLVSLAKERGASLIAITDHDGLDGIGEGLAAGEKLGVTLLPGIEFSARLSEEKLLSEEWNGKRGPVYLHLLGYGMDVENPRLKQAVAWLKEKRTERNQELLSVLLELGYRLLPEDIEAYPGQVYVGKPGIAKALVKRGYARDTKEAFTSEKLLAHPLVKAVHRVKIEAGEAISLIENAGGVAVLAHPMKIFFEDKNKPGQGSFFNKLEAVLRVLKGEGLSGVECYYSAHLPYETERLMELSRKFSLFPTAGSDFHGKEMNSQLKIGAYAVSVDEEAVKKGLIQFLLSSPPHSKRL